MFDNFYIYQSGLEKSVDIDRIWILVKLNLSAPIHRQGFCRKKEQKLFPYLHSYQGWLYETKAGSRLDLLLFCYYYKEGTGI